MSKEKIAFIAHSYHKKTQSYAFLVDYIKNVYDVDLIFDEEWETGEKINWAQFNQAYKAILIFQMFPGEQNLKLIQNSNIIYMPMYDHVIKWRFKDWLSCKNLKIINFSSTLHKKLKSWGFDSTYIQYFIEPKTFAPGNPNEVFFWQRNSKINLNTLKQIFKKTNIKIHIHQAIDPGQSLSTISKTDEEKFNITYSKWFETKEAMQEFIEAKSIYIAPRPSEGIGMSFLEAIAQGKLVIANNKPTMNEYIKHGKTGYLYNFAFPLLISPLKLNPDKILKMQQQTYEYAKVGHESWLEKRKEIMTIINSPNKNVKLKYWVHICYPFLLFNPKNILQFKLGSNPSLKIFGITIFNSCD